MAALATATFPRARMEERGGEKQDLFLRVCRVDVVHFTHLNVQGDTYRTEVWER